MAETALNVTASEGRKPVLSVLIPAYNCRKTIKATLDSICIQIDKPAHVYICDDASTDPWVEDILPGYLDRLPITVLRHETNTGPGGSRNTLIQHCLNDGETEWVTFLDSDDLLWTPAALSAMLDTVKNTKDLNVAIFAFLELHGDGAMGNIHKDDTVWMHGKCYRLQHWVECGVSFDPEQKWYEDGDVNFRLIRPDAGVFFSPIPVYGWMANMGSITRSQDYTFEVRPYYYRAFMHAYDWHMARNDKANADMQCIKAFIYDYWYSQCMLRRDGRNPRQPRITPEQLMVVDFDLGMWLRECGFFDRLQEMLDSITAEYVSAMSAVMAQEGPAVPKEGLMQWATRAFGFLKDIPPNQDAYVPED
jgi:glycosyltransferase involved in cell wall biosynthesis